MGAFLSLGLELVGGTGVRADYDVVQVLPQMSYLYLVY